MLILTFLGYSRSCRWGVKCGAPAAPRSSLHVWTALRASTCPSCGTCPWSWSRTSAWRRSQTWINAIDLNNNFFWTYHSDLGLSPTIPALWNDNNFTRTANSWGKFMPEPQIPYIPRAHRCKTKIRETCQLNDWNNAVKTRERSWLTLTRAVVRNV